MKYLESGENGTLTNSNIGGKKEKNMSRNKSMNKVQLAILTILAVFIMCSSSWAATYYVATNGNDGNPGTLSKPWETIGKANRTLKPGDTVHIRDGTYHEEIRPNRSGTSGSYITYAVYGSETVTIDRNNNGNGVDLDGRSYIKIDGINLTDCQAWVTSGTYGYDYCVIQNCYMKNASNYVGFEVRDGCDYNKILNCRIDAGSCYDGLNVGRNRTTESYGAHYNLIQGNEIIGGKHSCLNIGGNKTRYNIIRGNYFHHGAKILGTGALGAWTVIDQNILRSTRTNLMQIRSRNDIIRRNELHNDFSIASGNAGILLQATTERPNTRDIRVYNNTLYFLVDGGWVGVKMAMYDSNAHLEDNVFKNNILYNAETQNSSNYVVNYSRVVTTPPTDVFASNVIAKALPNIHVIRMYEYGDARLTLDEAKAAYLHLFPNTNIDVAPRFVDAGNIDFHLAGDSPCIDAGSHLTFTVGSGTGNEIVVEDAGYFIDGWNIVEGDLIQVGSNDAVRISEIDYDRNTITLTSSISWNDGDPVDLPYNGAKPDIGAYEYQSGTSDPIPPTPDITPFSQYYEAEAMDLTFPMALGTDTDAWGGEYISPSSGEASRSPLPEATLEFAAPETITYYLWIRMMGPDSSSDALYVGIDSAWDRVYPSATGTYEWVRVETSHNSGNYGFNLTAGNHTFQIGHGEINARADALFFTDDPNEIPQSIPAPDITRLSAPKGLRIIGSN
jgi:hypothetical protein